MNEHHFPIRYLWRAERTDSGGPGQYRGGIGGCHAFEGHHAQGAVQCTVWGHGVEQTAATGVLGGEPASANGFLVLHGGADQARSTMGHDPTESLPGRHELPAPKDRLLLAAGDVMLSWCSGGGGIGDPLLREPGRVCDDVDNGLVSPDRAGRRLRRPPPSRRWFLDG